MRDISPVLRLASWLLIGLAVFIVILIVFKCIVKYFAKPKRRSAAYEPRDVMVPSDNKYVNLPAQSSAIQENIDNVVNTKTDVASSIKERHDAAYEVVKEAITNIYSEAEECDVTANDSEFNNMLDELNKLSK